MSTDLVPVEQHGGTDLAVWAQGAREVERLATHLSQSALVPQAYRGKPVDLLACWLTGQELGIAPMAALRAIDVIQGTPSLRAHAMRALVLSRGHELEVVEADATHCVMRGRRKGSATWQTVTWDILRAKQLGLLGKDQWTKQPQTMLIARATGELCRLIAADVLYAVPYTTEEMGDQDAPVQASAEVARPKVSSLADIVQPAAEQVVNLGDAPLSEEQLITGPQSKKMHALLGRLGYGNREDGLSYINEVLDGMVKGKAVTSSKELTRVEAAQVIADLEALEAANAQAAAEINAGDPQPTLDGGV